MRNKTLIFFKKYFFAVVGFWFLLGMTSCDNEVKINANWKETIVVYGLIDPLDSIQYIKVNKAFLNENASAFAVAKRSDSLYLDSTKVTLIRLSTGQVIQLTKTNKLPKDSGIFANDVNYLWMTREKIFENEDYKVIVENPISKNAITATTKTLGKTRIIAPFVSSNAMFSFATNYLIVNFMAGYNAASFDIKLVLDYDEFAKDDTANKSHKQIIWNIVKNYPVVPQNAYLIQTERTAFLQFIAYSMHASPNLYHRIKSAGIRFYGGNQTLTDYISVNEPSIGIVQKTAEYTNINGGFGIFGSRCKQEIMGVKIDPASVVNILQKDSLTKPLNFVR